jgi:hypothetical protein
LQKLLPGCKIIPGKLSTVESKAEEFALRFQSTYESSYKFVARKGTTTQDLVIVVSNTKIYTQKIVQEKVDEALAPKSQAVSDKTDIPILSNYNRIKFQTSRALHKASVEKKQEHSQEKGKKVIEGKKVEDRARTLRTKGLDQDTAPQVAKRDESIVSGNERTRNSMKN